MFEYYELVVFTAGLPDYANWVLNTIDPQNLIKYRLFRNHAIHQKNIFIKDLARLGRYKIYIDL
jgi:CTD small phosphatase-like protein 2